MVCRKALAFDETFNIFASGDWQGTIRQKVLGASRRGKASPRFLFWVTQTGSEDDGKDGLASIGYRGYMAFYV